MANLGNTLMVSSCLALAAAAAHAETIAWWRMEGTSGDGATTIANSSSQSGLDATVSPENFAATYAPSFDAALTNAPENATGVYLPNANNLATGCFSVADDARLKPSGDFTVEAFFKWGETYTLSSGATAGLFGKVRDGVVSCAYGLGINGTSIVARFYTGSDELLTTTSVDPQDGKWHHAAITYEASTRKAKLYVDYVMREEKTLSADLVYASGTPFKIGSVGGRTFTGTIDEVRLSDEALLPDSFLEARIPHNAFLDVCEPAETAYRYRFGDGSIAFSEADWATTNTCAWRANQMTADVVDAVRVNFADISADSASGFLSFETATHPAMDDGVPAQTCYFAECRTNSFTNATSASFSGAGGYTFKVKSPDFLVGGDFTAECFVKAPANVTYVNFVSQLSGIQPSPYTPLWQIGTSSSGQLVFSYASTNGASAVTQNNIAFNKIYADGDWHHLAVVYEAASHSVRLYFDHELAQEATLEHALGGVGVSQTGRIGIRDGGWNGYVDEVRIARCALAPSEFMSTVAMPPIESGATVAHFGFDNSWEDSIAAYSTIQSATAGTLDVDGSTMPVFCADVKAPLVFEGKPGYGSVAFSTNTASVSISTGIVRIVEMPAYALKRKAFTAEWFVKFPGGGALSRWAAIADLVRAGGTVVWAVRVDQGSRLYACLNGTNIYPASDKISLNDGKWHHVALTCCENVDSTSTDVRLYIDYAEYLSGAIDEPIAYDSAARSQNVVRFGAPNGGAYQPFKLDEFRFSDGVKPVEDFLCQSKERLGICIIFR